MLQHFSYKGSVIQQRGDGFVNLTQMCQANGKRLDVFMKSQKTRDYIDVLTNQYHHSVVLDAGIGGDHAGTWGHPSLAINLARWISPQFAVWCDSHIFNLLASGKTSLDMDPKEEIHLKTRVAELECQVAQAEAGMLALNESVREENSRLRNEVSELRSAILSLAGSDRKFKRRLESVGFTPSLTEEVMEEIARRVERKYKGKEVLWTNLRTYGRSSSLHRTLRKKELNDICDRFGWEWVNSKVSV
jgi:uncharacterized coiled-coil protein SlyX